MIRKFARADGVSITIELEDGKRSMLILRHAAGMMVHLQFVDDVNEEVVQLDREGFKEECQYEGLMTGYSFLDSSLTLVRKYSIPCDRDAVRFGL